MDPSKIPALSPPSGVISNFDNPTSQASTILGVNISFITLMTSVVGLRVLSRGFVTRTLGWDDYTCFFAAVRIMNPVPQNMIVTPSNVGRLDSSHRPYSILTAVWIWCSHVGRIYYKPSAFEHRQFTRVDDNSIRTNYFLRQNLYSFPLSTAFLCFITHETLDIFWFRILEYFLHSIYRR